MGGSLQSEILISTIQLLTFAKRSIFAKASECHLTYESLVLYQSERKADPLKKTKKVIFLWSWQRCSHCTFLQFDWVRVICFTIHPRIQHATFESGIGKGNGGWSP